MYELVDAVNQQCTGINSGDLLVLTKFAELVAKPNEPRLRVSEKFLATITRMCVKTVQDHLKKLHKLGYLIALEDRAAKKPSDESTLYELRLPEGFDSDVISRRRGRYYGGKAIVCKKSGIDRNREDSFLTPVPNGVKDSDSTRITEKISTPLENSSEPLENSSTPLENSSTPLENSSTPLEKTSTINNIITKENNNTNIGGGGSLSGIPSIIWGQHLGVLSVVYHPSSASNDSSVASGSRRYYQPPFFTTRERFELFHPDMNNHPNLDCISRR